MGLGQGSVVESIQTGSQPVGTGGSLGARFRVSVTVGFLILTDDVHVGSECRLPDEAVFVGSDPNEDIPVEVPVVLLEVFNHLVAIADCGLDEAPSSADDDFLLDGHDVFFSGLGLDLTR